ncbi:glycosyltransferase [Marinobacter sp. 1-4A]|uniref:glycosyltransferase n=1 Tax=Marinobacter sp. 1-4A TaxID=2582919 RepID=UPI0019035D76|nr:glycosyltransferase [Marinobacter sp. 1-4A]MBK1849810.1 glycosyltransferase [Marinobacter sp. 1-4A]
MRLTFITIVVPAHNEENYIEECLNSLQTQDYPKEKYEIIVVNNNSKDRTRQIAEEFKVNIIDHKEGPVGAVRNAGAERARGDYLAFIDADCIAPKNWVTQGVKSLSSDDSVYGGGCDLRLDPHWIERAWLLENKEPPRELLGCCIFIKKSDFLTVGGFDETISSGEDTKLSVTLRALGYTIKMKKALNVIHLGNPLTIKQFISRQIWHSENYIQNWVDTKKDVTFYLTVFFIISLTSLTASMLIENSNMSLIYLILTLSIPTILTIKRLSRSKNRKHNLENIFKIYLLDFIYLVGRSVGLIKSTLKYLK